MRGHLIRIDSLGPDGAPLPLRLASVSEPELCHLDNVEWQPNIARLPTLRYDFFGGDFRGQIIAPSGGFSISTDGIADFAERVFAATRVRLWTGEVGDDWSGFRLLFDGLISGEPEVRAGIATFTMGTDAAWLDKPLLGLYEGTGGIEGSADMTGRTKPLTLGAVRFADAVLIDPVDLVYQVNDGSVEGVASTYDRVVQLGDSAGDNADLTALLADAIPPGRWGTSNALGLVRLGAPPDGRVSFDVEGAGGFARKPGEIIAYIASLAGGSVDAANLAALDAARPYNLQIQLATQTTARDVIQQIADSICAVAGITWTGGLFVQPLAVDEDPSETLAEDGTSDIAVSEVTRLAIAAPYWRLATEAERTFVVYSLGEVASGYNFRGLYAAATEYRIDDVVFAVDGRAFVYINATPGAGNAPPANTDSNSHWELFGSADVTSNVQSDAGAEVTIACDYTGTPKAGQINPRYVQFRFIRNGVDRTADATWSIASSTGTWTGTISDTGGTKGRMNITAITTDVVATVQGVLDGRVRTMTVKITRLLDPPPSGTGGTGGTSATGYVSGSASSTAMMAIGSELSVTIGSVGDAALSATYDFVTDALTAEYAYAKWYKWNGSAYVALGSEQMSGTDYNPGFPLPGQGSAAFTDTGNTAASTQKYRLYGRSSGAHNTGFSGSCSAVGS